MSIRPWLESTEPKITSVGKVATQSVAAAGWSKDAWFTFRLLYKNRPELFWPLYNRTEFARHISSARPATLLFLIVKGMKLWGTTIACIRQLLFTGERGNMSWCHQIFIPDAEFRFSFEYSQPCYFRAHTHSVLCILLFLAPSSPEAKYPTFTRKVCPCLPSQCLRTWGLLYNGLWIFRMKKVRGPWVQ